MSLTKRERAATSNELHANLVRSGLSQSELAAKLEIVEQRVNAVLALDGARPEDVWLVRDYLDRAIRSAGLTPQPYSKLTEAMRAAAKSWFPLTDVESKFDCPPSGN
ncbi:hypothetical protein SAMN05421642_10835 [Rhodococcoides kyotonense]|uniref:DUF2316 domain-containing protein n=1 Tax=Rhodococcoides kyotonense TaxID=398843 RepID=A0A239J423_9NOCA|nr:hypothetical protein SAMN05421642_10835 [Rhodococcus kyotonensis]